MHPGSYTTGTEAEGLALSRRRSPTLLRARPRAEHDDPARAHRRARAPISATASSIWRRSSSGSTDRRGSACASTPATCSPRATTSVRKPAIAATFQEFDRRVGLDRIRAFHLNDSKKPCGSRVDRHEHIGKGCLGLEPFRRLLQRSAVRASADAARDAEARYAREPAPRRRRSVGSARTCARCAGCCERARAGRR